MNTDDLTGFLWILLALFVFTILDFDVMAKQVRKNLFRNTSGGSSGSGSGEEDDFFGWI